MFHKNDSLILKAEAPLQLITVQCIVFSRNRGMNVN